MASTQKQNLVSKTAANADLTGSVSILPPKAGALIGVIKVSNIHAATTVSGKIQHSPDGTAWFDLLSFTAIAGAAGSEAKAVSSPVFERVRAVATVAGATQLADVTIDLYCDPRA
jgi:hypothetical protein